MRVLFTSSTIMFIKQLVCEVKCISHCIQWTLFVENFSFLHSNVFTILVGPKRFDTISNGILKHFHQIMRLTARETKKTMANSERRNLWKRNPFIPFFGRWVKKITDATCLLLNHLYAHLLPPNVSFDHSMRLLSKGNEYRLTIFEMR